MVIAIALVLQAVPLPLQVTPMPTADLFTRPLLSADCQLQARNGSGRLAFETTGGRAYAADVAPAAGQPVVTGFRRIPQVVHVRTDELGLFAGMESPGVDMGSHGGDVRFRSRLFGASRPGWWRFATFAGASSPAAPSRIHRAELVDAAGQGGYATGSCTLRAIPQSALTAEEIALEASR